MGLTREQIETATWWKGICETSNDTFLPLFFDRHRFLVLKGGGGSGKSVFAARKVVERCAREAGHRCLVVRKVARSLRDSCFELIKKTAYDYVPGMIEKIPKGNSSDMYVTFKNGSKILFYGLDDVEKLKSIFDITMIWIEEATEILESDLNQLDIRLRTESRWYLQFIITFNPISITHWLKKRFFDEKDPRVRIHESTYKDNRFLIEESRRTLEGFKDTDPYYYEVYCLGMWGTTGRTIFSGQHVTKRLLEDIKPVMTGMMEFDYDGLKPSNIRFGEDRNGYIQIFQKPEAGVPYVIGGDTAGDGSDSFVGWVIDNRDLKQVAILRQQFDEHVYARQMYCLGMYYNQALIGIENNFSTYPTMELERMGYPNLYARETIDEYTHQPQKRYGWVTSTKSRAYAIGEAVKIHREDIQENGCISIVSDKDTLQEMLTFVRDENYKPVAEEGAHDDCVMAMAITYAIRNQQKTAIKAKETAKTKWTPSMWEDYNHASKEAKKYLLEKWGRPE